MKKSLIIFFLFFLLIHPSFSQPGSMDLNFGPSNGQVVYDWMSGDAITTYGDIIFFAGRNQKVSTGVRVVALNPDGTPYTGFGNNDGDTTLTIPGTSVLVTGIAVNKTNGNIYVSGMSNDASGTPKGFVLGFDKSGKPLAATTPGVLHYTSAAGAHRFYTIALQTDGKIVVAGDSLNVNMITRLLPTGAKDNTFASDGVYNPATAAYPAGSIRRIDITSANELYAASEGGANGNYVIKVNSDGTYASSFQIPGQANYTIGGLKYNNGKILIVSNSPISPSAAINTSIIRSHLPDGKVDNTFNGTQGFITISPGTTTNYFTSLNLDQYGRIIAAGYRGGSSGYTVVRLNSNGTLSNTLPYKLITGSPTNPSAAAVLTADEHLVMIGSYVITITYAKLIKVNLKYEYNHTFGPFNIKYVGADPFTLPSSGNVLHPVTYSSSNPLVATVNGNQVAIKDSGTTVINGAIAGDSAYYPFSMDQPLVVQAIAPGIILGDNTILEGVATAKTYSISPDTLPGYWDFTEFYPSDPANYLFPNGQTGSEVDIYFTKNFTGGILSYTIFDGNFTYVIEKTIMPGPVQAESNVLDTVECPLEFGSCAGNYIDGFKINTISNESSGCGMGGYSDFTKTTFTTELNMGEPYQATIQIHSAGNTSTRYVAMWLDHNNDGTFTEDDFLGADFSNNAEVKFRNVLPKNNPLYAGPRRLRVRYVTNLPFDQTDACLNSNEAGETEDYLVILKQGETLQATSFVTPNEDGRNDFFVIRGIDGKKDNRLVIFDRFGDVKFKKDNYKNDWDGKEEGKLLNKGTYFYVFTNGQNQLKGFFELLY